MTVFSPAFGVAALVVAALGAVALGTPAFNIVANGRPASSVASAACESLTGVTLADTTITSAVSLPAGGFTIPATRGGAPATVPAFCRVTATLTPTPESNIKIEVWLPPADRWNGKLLGTGNGGAGGTIAYGGLVNGLERGYATANTDMGTTTTGLDFSFGVGHPEMVKDWAYRSTHLMTVAAKQIARTFYDRDARLSYFTGCSTGGHQALTEALRFPDDYNGIVSGDPANNRTHLHVVGIWNFNATHVDPESYFPLSKAPMINRAVLAACDRLDGVADGIIDDPRRCHFDPATIVCRNGDAPDCLTEKQAAALKKIYAGPSNPRTGDQIFPGMSPGSEVNPLGLERALARPSETGGPQRAVGTLANWATSFTGPFFDFDRDMAAVDAELGPIVNDVSPDLSALKKRGARLIMYTGWADPLIPARDLVGYYERVTRAMGGADRTREFARLFMVPGMGHCGSGTAPNQFDTLSALDRWMDSGVAPDRLIASHRTTGGVVDRTRPLCPYPQAAKWTGAGSMDEAANFACVNQP